MTPDRRIVYVVDDEPSVLRGIQRLLTATGLQVCAFASARSFLDHYDAEAAGCLVLDIAMPGLSGLDVQEHLAARGAILPLIFLTGHADVQTSVRAMKRGADDFLTKPVNDTDLLAAIEAALGRNDALRKARAEQAEIERLVATLTPREREVLAHVVSGELNKQVAAHLGTAEKTIKVHRGRIMDKLKVRSLAQLVRLADRAGITAERDLPLQTGDIRHPGSRSVMETGQAALDQRPITLRPPTR